jgi:hypothetical protein
MKENRNCESQERGGGVHSTIPNSNQLLPRPRLRIFGCLPGSLVKSVRKAPCRQASRVFRSAQKNQSTASNQTRDLRFDSPDGGECLVWETDVGRWRQPIGSQEMPGFAESKQASL